MPTKKIEPQTPRPKTKSAIDLFPDTPFLDEVERALSALPDESTAIYLYRVRPEGRPLFLSKLSPGQFNLSSIQERWGGGTYKAVSIDSVDDDRQERDFEIAGAARNGDEKPVFVKEPASNLSLDARLDRLERLLSQGISHNNGGGNEAITGLLTKIIESSVNSEERILSNLVRYKELFGGSNAPQQNQSAVDAATLVNIFQRGVEAAGDSESPPWLVFVKELMPQVQEILSRVVSSPQFQAKSLPSVAPEKITMPPQPETGFLSLRPMIQPYLFTFIDAASGDDDPGLLVPMVARRISPDKKEIVLQWLNSDKWFSDLVSLDQRIGLQRGWWQEFVEQLREELAPQTQTPEEPERE